MRTALALAEPEPRPPAAVIWPITTGTLYTEIRLGDGRHPTTSGHVFGWLRAEISARVGRPA